VARAGNFGRAARELNLSQPTITHQIQKLEEGLGTQLFIRHGRGVTLTPAGACLFDRLDIIMHLLSAPLGDAPSPERAVGTLSLALPAECAPLLVPALLAACRTRWPGLTLTVREGDSASLEEWVIAGRADIGVLQDPPALDALEIEPVLTERLGLVAGARSPMGGASTPVRPYELAGLPMILPYSRHWIRRRVENAFFRRGIALDHVQQIESLTVTKAMVREGQDCTILPFAAVQEEAARGTLVFRPIEQMPLFAVHAIAWRKPADAPPAAAFARTLREVMCDLTARGLWAGASVADTAARHELDVRGPTDVTAA
jgi:LysR family nitrogen assimilation transcriptional regulator